jgi:serine/threonine protein kinase
MVVDLVLHHYFCPCLTTWDTMISKYYCNAAQILAECHQRGVVHGDVKPANIMSAGEECHAALIDFGTASFWDGVLVLHSNLGSVSWAYRGPPAMYGHGQGLQPVTKRGVCVCVCVSAANIASGVGCSLMASVLL